MKTHIIFIDDLTAVGGQVFVAQLKSRMSVKGFKVIEKDLFSEIMDFSNIFNYDYSIKSNQVFFSCLSIMYALYVEIENMHKLNTSDICYIVNGIPFLYNLFKYVTNDYLNRNEKSLKLIEKFSRFIQQTTTYISVDSYTDIVKDHLDEKRSWQKEYYNFLLNGETSTKAKLIAIEDTKQALAEGFHELRKKGFNCIKCSINFGEDISDNIIKVFDRLKLY